MPHFRPMLAKPSEGVPSGGDWSFEVKWDGIRGVAVIRDGVVRLQSRSGKTEQSSHYPAIAEQLAAMPDVVLDGELLRPGSPFFPGSVVPDGGVYVVFDLLECPPQGAAIKQWPLAVRRRLLNQVLDPLPPNVILSPVFDDGEALMRQVAEWGWEGVVAKRNESRYLEGRRTEAWLKVKVRREQEFIVCGWTDGKNGRAGTIGGLLLGYYTKGLLPDTIELIYAGRVGARLEDEAELRRQLVPRSQSPFSHGGLGVGSPHGRHWVEPTVVVQVAFQKWTDDHKLWHPTCKGLRTDKAARDVVRET